MAPYRTKLPEVLEGQHHTQEHGMRQQQQLGAFIARTRHGRAAQGSSLKLGPSDPQRHFSPERHGLTPEQCRTANALLRKAEQARPLSGNSQQVGFRRACRIGGILRAVRGNLVGNTRFGHHLMGYRGGRVMQRHGLHILREIYPVGLLAIQIARERKRATQYYEEHGEVLPIGTEPAHSPEAQRIQALNDAWEVAQWMQQVKLSRW